MSGKAELWIRTKSMAFEVVAVDGRATDSVLLGLLSGLDVQGELLDPGTARITLVRATRNARGVARQTRQQISVCNGVVLRGPRTER